MDALGLYIQEALRYKEKIYLPGIGTFTKERIPAFFNDLKQCFMPPSQSITLTDTSIASEKSLIEFIAEKENISAEESLLKFEQAILELESEVREKKEIILEGFGKLKKVEGRYEFTHFLPDNEGIFNDYEPAIEIDILLPDEEKASIPASDINIDETPLPVEESEISEEYTEQDAGSAKWLWPTLAFVVCAGIAAFWFFNPNIRDFINTNRNTAASQAIIEQTTSEPPVQATDLNMQSQSSETLEEVIEAPVNNESESIVKEAQGNFEIIIAAFNTMAEAEDFVNRTNAKGYHVYIIKNNNPGNLNKISYGPFQTAAEAEQALIKVREELTKEAWIFKNKK